MKTGSDTAHADTTRRAGAAQASERMQAGAGISPLTSGVPSRMSDSAKSRAGMDADNRPEESTTPGSGKKPGNSGRPTAARILLWILRKGIVPLIWLIALIGGLYIGYVTFGKGPEADVWEWSTWKHMYDLVFSDT